MIPRIKGIKTEDNLRLRVTFDNDEQVIYNVEDDVDTIADFRPLETENGLFKNFQLDPSRTCVYWSDRIDLPSDAILECGEKIGKI